MNYATIKDGQIFVQVDGSLNIKVAVELKEEIDTLLDTGQRKVTFDFSKTSYIDSTGLGVLVEIKDRLDEINGETVVINLHGRCLDVFQATRLDEDFCKSEGAP